MSRALETSGAVGLLAKRYELRRVLGRGGMGVVYEAHDTLLERSVAVKILHLADAEAAARLRREVRIVAEMDHPGIVPVHDVGDDEGVPFFVMPLVRGVTLRARLAEGPLPEPLALEIGAQVADALEYSHVRRVVHRDIKPENIMVLTDDEATDVKVRVMDFGIAVRTGRAAGDVEIAGTPAYLAPEQPANHLQSLKGDRASQAEETAEAKTSGTEPSSTLLSSAPWCGARYAFRSCSRREGWLRPPPCMACAQGSRRGHSGCRPFMSLFHPGIRRLRDDGTGHVERSEGDPFGSDARR